MSWFASNLLHAVQLNYIGDNYFLVAKIVKFCCSRTKLREGSKERWKEKYEIGMCPEFHLLHSSLFLLALQKSWISPNWKNTF